MTPPLNQPLTLWNHLPYIEVNLGKLGGAQYGL